MNKKNIILAIVAVAIIIAGIIYTVSSRDGWEKDETGQWKRVGDPTEILPQEIIEDCFNNVGNILAGLVIGDCQKRLCLLGDTYCTQRVTEVFNGMTGDK